MRRISFAIWVCLFVTNLVGAESKKGNSFPICQVQIGEELVYGKVGLADDGNIKYTFAIIRNFNGEKQVLKRALDSSGSYSILNSNILKFETNANDYDKFDYWVVFNGKRFGPYSRIDGVNRNEQDVDEWVTRDGKGINFVGWNDSGYSLIIGGREVLNSQEPSPIVSFDCKSGTNTYVMRYGFDDYRLVENGVLRLDGWRLIDRINYSEDGQNLLYVGAKANKDELYVYLNHEIIAGPYQVVSQLGFVPGTNQVYFVGCSQVIDDSVVVCSFGYIAIGKKRIIIPDGGSVGDFSFCQGRVSFYVSSDNPDAKNKDCYKAKDFVVYEYNTSTGETKQHDGYGLMVQTVVVGDSFYYETYNKQGDKLLVKEGGAVLDIVSRSEGGDGAAFFRVAPNGTFYTGIGNSINQKVTLKRNGKSFVVSDIPVVEVEKLSFSSNYWMSIPTFFFLAMESVMQCWFPMKSVNLVIALIIR